MNALFWRSRRSVASCLSRLTQWLKGNGTFQAFCDAELADVRLSPACSSRGGTVGIIPNHQHIKIMKLKYTIWRDASSHQYNHIHLSIYTLASLDRSFPHPALSIQWQGDNLNTSWYAFRAESTCDNSRDGSEVFAIAASIMRKLTKADESSDFSRDIPGKVIEAIGAERVVDDSRMNKWVTPEMCAPADWKRYMALDGQQCVISVCAPDEETASKMIFNQFAEYADKGSQYSSSSYYQRRLESWILAGKPIRVDHYAKAKSDRLTSC